MPRRFIPALMMGGLALALSGCSESGAQSMVGTRAATADLSDLRDFASVEAAGPDTVIVTVGPAFNVTAQGDPEALNRIEIGVKDGVLHIGRRPRVGGMDRQPDKGATIRVAMPALASASLAGSGDMTVDKAQGDTLDLSLTGSGNLAVATAKVRTLKAGVTGSGDMRIGGTAGTASLSATGSGGIDAAALKAGSGDINVLGSGDARLASDGTVAVHIMGSGNADVIGKAKCTVAAMGSGKARCSG